MYNIALAKYKDRTVDACMESVNAPGGLGDRMSLRFSEHHKTTFRVCVRLNNLFDQHLAFILAQCQLGTCI